MPTSPKRFLSFSPSGLRLAQKCALIALAAWSLGAAENYGPPNSFEEPDDSAKTWTEVALKLPAAPKDGDLLPLYIGPTAKMQFFVDGKSLTADSDGVVRYTLVSKSESGAVNVSYEGIRCATYQKRQYAFGRADGSWAVVKQEKWVPITELVVNRQDAELAKFYLCDAGTVAGPANTIVKHIKEERSMRPGDPSTNR